MKKNNYFYISTIIIFIILFISPLLSAKNKNAASSKYLISAPQLKSIINDNNLTVIDVRKRSSYVMGHISGAVNMWKEDFSRINGWIEGQIPSAEYFSFVCQERNINIDSEIVIYDEKNSLWASRLWWIFRFYGHDNVKILEGGLTEWKNSGYQTKIFAVLPEKKGDFVVKSVKNDWLIDTGSLSLKMPDENCLILDVRSQEEFSGKEKNISVSKSHLPGSVNIEWRNVIDNNGFFKSPEEIKKIYEKKDIINNDKTVIIISNTAVRAAHSFFALHLAGFDNIKLYDDAYLGWHKKNIPQ
ncbi:MAG: sulfurtransferase [Bacillota bacterium]